MDEFRRVNSTVGRKQQVCGDRIRKPAAQMGGAEMRGLSESPNRDS